MDWLKIDPDTGEIELVSEEVKMVPVLQALSALNYNKAKGDLDGRKRYRMRAELKYMYFMYSFTSPYVDYNETERHVEALIDAGLPEDWKPSKEFTEAADKYRKASPNKVMRLLKTTESFVDKFEVYLNGIDLNERTPSGAAVHDPSKIMTTIQKLPGLAQTLFELQSQARMGIIASKGSRGDQELGWTAINSNANKDIKALEEDDE
jgi:hypothetical protein